MEETKQQKLSQPFVPIPVSFLNEMIANETAPLSHRVLAVILRQMFDTRKKEQDKLTVSYIAKVLKLQDRRKVQRSIDTLCKYYPFEIKKNGQGCKNEIALKTCYKNVTSKPATKMSQEPATKMSHTIEYRIEDSIKTIEITGDEWC